MKVKVQTLCNPNSCKHFINYCDGICIVEINKSFCLLLNDNPENNIFKLNFQDSYNRVNNIHDYKNIVMNYLILDRKFLP